MKNNRQKTADLFDKMINNGITEKMLLMFLINDYMSGQEALLVLETAEQEFFNDPDDFHSEEEYDVSSFDEED